MFDKIKQIMEMKKQAEHIKRELDATSVESNEVQGIRIVINGSQHFQSVEIDDQLLQAGEKAKFENDLLHSINAAIKKSQDLAAKKMKEAMPGLPGV